MRYRFGKSSFPTKEMKEHYILEGSIHDLEWVYKSAGKKLPFSQREILKLNIRLLKASYNRIKKNLTKKGLFNPIK